MGIFASMLATPPMMAKWRVVLLWEAEVLAKSSRSRKLVGTLLDSPPPGLALILVASIPKGSRSRFYVDLKKRAQSVEFPEMTVNDLPGWLLSRAREEYGVDIEEDAARALGVAVGTNIGVLAQELRKLADFVEEGRAITVEDVETAGIHLPAQDRWQWFDLVGEGRFPEALAGLSVLLDGGESGVGLTVGLATHLLRIGTVVEGGAARLEETLPRHQKWLTRRIAAQARRWSAPEIEKAVLELRRVDRLLKASGFSDRHLIEEWLLGIMARRGSAAA